MQKASVGFRSFLYEGKNVFYDIAEDPDFDRLSIHERRISSNLFV